MRRLRISFFRLSAGHVILLLFAFLMSCRSNYYIPIDPPKLPQRVAGTSDATMLKLQTILKKRGVSVVTIGEDYLITIPSDALFPPQSPRLTWESYAVLNDVVCFLKQFRKVAVTVTSFSSRYISAKRERALTLARARVVGDYLWSQKIGSRFIFTEGLGSDKPIIMQNDSRSANSRIEITFRDAIV